MRFLWKQAATITPVSGSDLQFGRRGTDSTDSEKEREREMVEAAGKEEERPEPSPKEVWKSACFVAVVWISGKCPNINNCVCVSVCEYRSLGIWLSQRCLIFQVKKNHWTVPIQ